MPDLMPDENILKRIYNIRGHRVMLDSDLADLYGVPIKALNQAVKRNIARFPDDFMFQLDPKEALSLRSQVVTLENKEDILGRGRHRKYLQYAFTEQGVAMLSGVLTSDRAVQVNIQIMRTFTRLRRMLSTHEVLKRKIENMEKKYDDQFGIVFRAIKQLLAEEEKPKRKIGFKQSREEK